MCSSWIPSNIPLQEIRVAKFNYDVQAFPWKYEVFGSKIGIMISTFIPSQTHHQSTQDTPQGSIQNLWSYLTLDTE